MDLKKMFEDYPKACEIVKQWFLEQMLESFKDESVPDDFKDFVRQKGIETEQVVKIIGSNPRSMFQVFDENKLYIEIRLNLAENPEFSWGVNGNKSDDWYTTRTEAELKAVIECLKQLNEKA
jgi:hypothetical protein